jgi:predicted transcriptional regulator of viral defense system
MRRDPAQLRRTLAQVARTQAGYFSAAQALRVGYSYPSQRYHTRRGDWLRVDRGIYRLPDWPATQHEDLARWTLWSRGQGVVSHETALAVHELGDVMPARVHLTVPPRFRSRSAAVVLHQADLDAADTDQFEGFTVTTAARSLLDSAAAGTEVDQLSRAVADALDRGLVTVEALRARADGFGAAAALAIERALQQVSR